MQITNENYKEYNPFEKTAIIRKKLSKPMQILLHKGYLDKNKTILDFACGFHEDVDILKEQGFNIVGYDKYNPLYNNESLLHIKNKYDIVISNYMFNVIPDLEEHNELIEYIKTLGKNIYICVRSDVKAIQDSWQYIEKDNVWKTSTGSYQRFYSSEDCIQYFGDVEFIVNNNTMRLFRLKL